MLDHTTSTDLVEYELWLLRSENTTYMYILDLLTRKLYTPINNLWTLVGSHYDRAYLYGIGNMMPVTLPMLSPEYQTQVYEFFLGDR